MRRHRRLSDPCLGRSLQHVHAAEHVDVPRRQRLVCRLECPRKQYERVSALQMLRDLWRTGRPQLRTESSPAAMTKGSGGPPRRSR